ncbi:hypothetical protein R1sor_002421 [Riccia sorocarpa]|uniref:Uncharacterized protein n=1 Tax=Riccia sorocarpa TaxID=122646 RepID=A0ABD3H2R3_9MARC
MSTATVTGINILGRVRMRRRARPYQRPPYDRSANMQPIEGGGESRISDVVGDRHGTVAHSPGYAPGPNPGYVPVPPSPGYAPGASSGYAPIPLSPGYASYLPLRGMRQVQVQGTLQYLRVPGTSQVPASGMLLVQVQDMLLFPRGRDTSPNQ